MRLEYQRRLAASILGIGVNRVYISPDPKEQENILDAITREGVRGLIRRHVIQKRPEQGVSRGRARHRAAQRSPEEEADRGPEEGADQRHDRGPEGVTPKREGESRDHEDDGDDHRGFAGDEGERGNGRHVERFGWPYK